MVLMLIVTLAFFSRAQLNRQISSASASNQQARLLARTAVENFVWDLRHEIEAGSEPDPLSASPENRPAFLPRAVATNLPLLGVTTQLSVYPSMLPDRVVAASAPPLLIKQTLGGSNFFRNRPGVTNLPFLPPIPARASTVSTTTPPLVGEGIAAESWNLPGLHAANETVPAPNWVYVNRAGGTPIEFASTWRDRQSTNANYIIGRFAYNVYDVGGLIDMNVAGNSLEASENSIRNRLHQIQLTQGDGDLQVASFADFVAWRSPLETTNSLSDPSRTFVTVDNAGLQALTGRQDLLAKADRSGSPVPVAATRFLHTSNRSVVGPAHMPDPGVMAFQPNDLNAGEINAPLLGARFATETTLQRGTDEAVIVPAGTPVMARKFPLAKLALLSDPDTAPEDLAYYFGLTRQSADSFRYTAAAPDGRIKRPAEIAAEGREPNFFEILQAVIVAGSLGRNAGDSYTMDDDRDEKRNIQVWQIGANIIDQWDENYYPTQIQFFSPNTAIWESVHGLENLPHIHSIAILGYRPEWDRNRFQVWAVFDLWNPHQNAQSPPPSEISAFRIRARSGQLRVHLAYQVGGLSAGSTLALNIPETIIFPDFQSVTGLNAGRQVLIESGSLPADGAPFLAGPSGPPNDANWAGGLLLCDVPNVPPAVPPDIETLVDNPSYASLINSLNQYLDARNLPRIGEPGGTFGAKAHNRFRLYTPFNPDDRVVIDLEYFHVPRGEWVRYQTLEGFFPRADGSAATAVTSQRQVSIAEWLEDTLISENPQNEKSFYGWGFDSSPQAPLPSNPNDLEFKGLTLMKFDPRTVRFGHSELRMAQRGRTIRQSTTLPGTYPSGTVARNLNQGWMMLDGRSSFLSGVNPLQSLQPANAIQWQQIPLANRGHYVPFGFLANIPEGSLAQDFNPIRYRDRDGLIRPGDGYLGAIPTALPVTSGVMADRPVMLNRPFRSVGELGYVFRDLPWKSLDFFTRNSGDLGLLDVFSLEDTPGEMPVVAGQVNLNSAPVEVLATLLAGASRRSDGTNPLTALEARDLADSIVAERDNRGPFLHVGDLVARVFSPDAHKVTAGYNNRERKEDRESSIRALSSLTCTRTWNFLMDLVVQSGRFGPGSNSASDFVVTSQKRYWVSLAVDRISGEVLSEQWEPVDEE
jgi:hypothetical protein